MEDDRKKSIRQLAAVFAALVVLVSLDTYWATRPKPKPNRVYRVIYNQNPPYYHLEPGAARPDGAIVDLFNEAAKLRGVQLKWLMWHYAPEELFRQGKADLLLTSVVTPERARSFYLTEPWLCIEGQLVW